MANDMTLRVSKEDFQDRINQIEDRMADLMDVIERYNDAKRNLDQFIIEGDSNYEAMLERIDINVKAAGKSYAALQETKVSLEETVNHMTDMSSQVNETIDSAIGAVGSVINAALKIDDVL